MDLTFAGNSLLWFYFQKFIYFNSSVTNWKKLIVFKQLRFCAKIESENVFVRNKTYTKKINK